jgi:ribosome biogenesis GTPase A
MSNEKSCASTSINWYPGHMAKTKRLINENIDAIDIVYEVVDARIPYSTRVRNLDIKVTNKPRILVFTKMDLCDKVETTKWIKYYESNGEEVVCLDLEHNPNLKPLFSKTKELMSETNAKRAMKGMNEKRARVLIIGVPNAGKSTLINRLVGKKAVNVGNKPGVTKNLNWIRINEDVELLDTPGILWPKLEEETVAFNLACFTAIREEILPIYEVIEYFLRALQKYYPEKLESRYGIKEIDEDIVNTLDIIGKKRGCLIKGGEIDYDKVIQVIMSDIKDGLIKNITFDRFEECVYG